MKKLFFIALILVSVNAKAQTCCDTVPQLFMVIDSSHYFNYYEKNGFLVYKQVGYNAKLAKLYIAKPQELINKQIQMRPGYEIYSTHSDMHMELIKKVGLDYQPFPKPFIIVSLGIPKDGF